jgi:hypothetical protein
MAAREDRVGLPARTVRVAGAAMVRGAVTGKTYTMLIV